MGVPVRFQDDLINKDADDEEVIAFAARKGWAYLTADHGPAKRGGLLLRAVWEYGAKCFVLIRVNHLPARDKAEVVQTHLRLIEKITSKRNGPFAYRLHQNGTWENLKPS